MIDRKRKGKTTISPLLTFNLKVGFTFSVLSPKACPYVIMRPPIVADINQRIFEGKRDSGIFIFAFSDNLISKYWFFAEGEWFLSF